MGAHKISRHLLNFLTRINFTTCAVATLELYQTVGGVFDSSNPAPDPAEKIGTMTIEWSSCNAAIVSYAIDTPLLVGEFPIQRVVPNNISLCESLQ